MKLKSLALALLRGLVFAPFLLAGAYFYGPWPTSVVCEFTGPPGTRIVKLDGELCDHELPCRISLWRALMRNPDVCGLEAVSGDHRFRGRLSALGSGGFLTGHRAFIDPVESCDASVWLKTGFGSVEVRAPAGDGSWFGYVPWGKQHVVVDGEEFSPRPYHIVRLNTESGRVNDLRADAWSMQMEAECAVCVQVSEWGGSDRAATVLRFDDAGFTWGSVDDGVVVRELAMDRETVVAGDHLTVRLGVTADRVSTRIVLSRSVGNDLRLAVRVSR